MIPNKIGTLVKMSRIQACRKLQTVLDIRAKGSLIHTIHVGCSDSRFVYISLTSAAQLFRGFSSTVPTFHVNLRIHIERLSSQLFCFLDSKTCLQGF